MDDSTLNLSSPTVRESDLSARAKIREAALDLFGSLGFGVSLRTIAKAAGVSPGLVVHHFGTKERLREAVEQSVLDAFQQQFAALPEDLPGNAFAPAIADVFAEVIASSPQLRRYLRRSLIEDTPAGSAIFDELVAAISRGLERLEQSGELRQGSDPTWRPYEVLSVILGPVLLESMIERNTNQPTYSPDTIRQRTDAHLDFISHALLARPAPDSTT